jgi:hypothetical protein
MKSIKLEKFNSKHNLTPNECKKVIGGAKEGRHRFLFWTWDTSIYTWDNDNGTESTQVTRCND